MTDAENPRYVSALVPQSVHSAEAAILDRGYRRYDGERRGTAGAMRSVMRATFQAALGMHRKARYKVLPLLSIVLCYVPATVFIGVLVLANQAEERQRAGGLAPAGTVRAMAGTLVSDYPGLYQFIVAAVALFTAFVAPEVLCTDRRTGMFELYLASPLTRWTYLGAKAMAIGTLLSAVTLGPPLVMLIGYSTQNFGPSSFSDWLLTLLRVLLVGGAISLFYTLLSAAVSSITTRRTAASAVIALLIVGSGLISVFLREALGVGSEWGAFDLFRLPSEFAYRVFGQPSPLRGFGNPVMESWLVYVSMCAWMLLSAAMVWIQYRRAGVQR